MCRKKMDHQVNGACILGIKSKAIFMQKKGEYQVNGACIQAEPSSRTLSGACRASRVINLKRFI